MTDTRANKRLALQRGLARQWRDTEADCLAQLAALLPLPGHVISQLGKPAILRITKTYIRAKQLEENLGGSIQALGAALHTVDLLDGFLLTVDDTGLILDVSDHVHKILGYQPHEMLGFSILEFMHPDDHMYFYHSLRYRKPRPWHPSERQASDVMVCGTGMKHVIHQDFMVRLKYKIANNLKKVKQTGYVGMQLRGLLKTADGGMSSRPQSVLTAACYPFCLLPCIEMNTFEGVCVVRIDSRNRFTYFDEGWAIHAGFDTKPYIGIPLETSFHPAAMEEMLQGPHAFIDQRGSMVSKLLVITKDGQLFQTVCQASSVFGSKGEKLFSVNVGYVLRRDKITIKHWPLRNEFMFLLDSYGLPGEEQVTLIPRLAEVADLDPGFTKQNASPSYPNIEHRYVDSYSTPMSPDSCGSGSFIQSEHNSKCSIVSSDLEVTNILPVSNTNITGIELFEEILTGDFNQSRDLSRAPPWGSHDLGSRDRGPQTPLGDTFIQDLLREENAVIPSQEYVGTKQSFSGYMGESDSHDSPHLDWFESDVHPHAELTNLVDEVACTAGTEPIQEQEHPNSSSADTLTFLNQQTLNTTNHIWPTTAPMCDMPKDLCSTFPHVLSNKELTSCSSSNESLMSTLETTDSNKHCVFTAYPTTLTEDTDLSDRIFNETDILNLHGESYTKAGDAPYCDILTSETVDFVTDPSYFPELSHSSF